MRDLSKRLEAAVSLVSPGHAVLDVGCDHAYAAAELVGRGLAPLAVASDVNRGPLEKAGETVTAAGLSERIRLTLADGIPADYPEFTGELPVTAFICGMGGMLIRKILSDAWAKGLCPEEIICSPQRDQGEVRRWLAAHGYEIIEELFLIDEEKPYVLIKAHLTGREEILSEDEADFGPVLIRKKDEILKSLLERRIPELRAIRDRIRLDSEKKERRVRELEQELRRLERIVEEMKE